jgi:aspartate aminotransferase
MVRMAGGEPVIVHASAERDFKIGPTELAAAITPRTRLFFLNSPSNPTGAMYSRGELEALGAVLEEHPKIAILSDEIYEHIAWSERFVSFAEACPDLLGRTLTVNGMSKAYAMSGWRIGYAAGPLPLIKAMVSIQSQSTTSACTVSQAAACAALTGDQQCVRDMCAAFEERHAVVLEKLAAIRGFECVPAAGTFYLFPNIRGAMDAVGAATDVDFCERLLEATGVTLVPGTAFGAPGHLRVSFAASLEVLQTALIRMRDFVAGAGRD